MSKPNEPRVGPVGPAAAEEIRAIRESLKLSREQFAARLGVTVRSIQNWEGGFKVPIHPVLIACRSFVRKEAGSGRRRGRQSPA